MCFDGLDVYSGVSDAVVAAPMKLGMSVGCNSLGRVCQDASLDGNVHSSLDP